jgi:hypothetical protein
MDESRDARKAGWLTRNGQGIAAVFSALAVLVAVAGLFYQAWRADVTQRAQSARDIYREFVALTVNKPDLAVTQWSDDLSAERKAAYEAYVEYLLYTAEQVIASDAGWAGPMQGWLEDHAAFLCARVDLTGYTPAVQDLVTELKARECP